MKSLKSDVQQRTGEEIGCAVITVPAMFELPACDATRRAAKLAGLENCPLLQEPVAAAIAYGFSAAADNVFWLVYDFGGGTFDASLVAVRDGRISVVDHDGENHLGGKDFDWALLDEIVLPELRKQYALSNFERGNPKYRVALAKLKAVCEKVKIELSRSPSAILEATDLCEDERGKTVDADIEISAARYARCIEKGVAHSIAICKRVLGRNNLQSADVEKLILVGGPTLTPALREMLTGGLGIPLDISVDPITAVARGAAIFAGTQMMPARARAAAPVALGTLEIELQYEPMSPDAEPFVGGLIRVKGGELPSCRIEFVRGDGGWRSGQLPVKSSGAFAADLVLQERRPNTFAVEVRDAQGNLLPTDLPSFVMTHGLGIDNPPLPRSLGVALASDAMHVYLRKDSPLPARGKAVHRTNQAFARGGEDFVIPLIEGEHRKASRNRLIGEMRVSSREFKRDLPLGAEVEVRIEMDESRELKMTAYIPVLDQEFANVKSGMKSQTATPALLGRELDAQKARLETLSEGAGTIQSAEADRVRDLLFEIEMQDTLGAIESLIRAASGEMDAAKTADEPLKELAARLDEADDWLEWPQLEAKAAKELALTREAVEMAEDRGLENQLTTLERELQAALRARDRETAQARIKDTDAIWFQARQKDPNFWFSLLMIAKDKPRHLFSDYGAVQRLFGQADDAVNRGDHQSLRRLVDQIYGVGAPMPAPGFSMRSNGSGQGEHSSALPTELQGFNWGAFFTPFFWGIAHNTWIALLCLVTGLVGVVFGPLGSLGAAFGFRAYLSRPSLECAREGEERSLQSHFTFSPSRAHSKLGLLR